jgi:hypothetical protein
MEYIAHRVNTARELKALPHEYGVELDLRDHDDGLILQHEPFVTGERFDDFLREYRHGTMILNIKSERIEHRVLELLRRSNVERFFFLDSSFPMTVALSSQGVRAIALRFSEFEGLDTILNMAGRVDWVWVDCFSRLPLDRASYRRLKEANFKLCLVSPDLVGRPDDIPRYREWLEKEGVQLDAVCAKRPNMRLWGAPW